MERELEHSGPIRPGELQNKRKMGAMQMEWVPENAEWHKGGFTFAADE